MYIAFMAIAAAAAAPAPKPIDIGSWFSADDYPVEAMRKGIEGSVTFEVDVDATGKPGACRILSSSGSPILDQATCDAVHARARFEPARNPDGKPVPGKYEKATVWRLGSGTATTYQAAILDFSVDSTRPTCTVKTGPYPLGNPTCAQILERASQQHAGDRVLKLVFLLAIGSGDKPAYQGEAEWGRRVSYLVSEQYSRKGALPIACISVAAEGAAAGRDACAGFPGARTISDRDKAEAMETRTEESIFAIMRAPSGRGTCDTGESAGEAQACH